MSNQTLIGMAIIAAILIGFYAPSTYFDHKVNACMNAYVCCSSEWWLSNLRGNNRESSDYQKTK